MIWASLAVRVLAGLALVIVGVAVVRPRSPRSGWLVGAAGALLLLTTCCARAMSTAALHEAAPPLLSSSVGDVSNWVADVVVAALIALALIWLGESKSGG